jgi:hypothetical protein
MTTKVECAYCDEEHLLRGERTTNLGTGDYVRCPHCWRWQLVPISTVETIKS